MPVQTLDQRLGSFSGQPRDLLPRYVPLPLDIVGGAISNFQERQQQGLEDYNAIRQFARQAINNQIPIQARQEEVRAMMEDLNATIGKYAESQDFTNFKPAMNEQINDLMDVLAPYEQDYMAYQAALAKGAETEGFTAADRYAAIDRPMQEMEAAIARGEDPGRFRAGKMQERLNVSEFLDKYVKGFDPEGGYSLENGLIVRREGVDPNKVRIGAMRALMNEPGYLYGLRNDISYEMANMSDADKDKLLDDSFDEIDNEINRINNLNASDEAKQEAIDKLNNERDTLTQVSDETIDSFIFNKRANQITSQLVDPYATRVAGPGNVVGATRDPLMVAQYKASISGDGDGSTDYLPSSFGTVSYTGDDLTQIPDQIERNEGAIMAIEELLSTKTPGSIEARALEAQLLVHKSNLQRQSSILNTVVGIEGIDMEAVNRIKSSKPAPPPGITQEELDIINNPEKSSPLGTSSLSYTAGTRGSLAGGLPGSELRKLSPEAQSYYRDVQGWRSTLGAAELETERRLNQGLENYRDTYGETNIRGVTLPAKIRSTIKSLFNGLPDNSGVVYLDPTTLEPIVDRDDLPDSIEDVSGISTEIVDGSYYIPVVAKVGNKSINMIAVPNTDLAVSVGKAVTGTPELNLMSSMMARPDITGQITSILPGSEGTIILNGRDLLNFNGRQHKIVQGLDRTYSIVDESGMPLGDRFVNMRSSSVFAAITDIINQTQ